MQNRSGGHVWRIVLLDQPTWCVTNRHQVNLSLCSNRRVRYVHTGSPENGCQQNNNFGVAWNNADQDTVQGSAVRHRRFHQCHSDFDRNPKGLPSGGHNRGERKPRVHEPIATARRHDDDRQDQGGFESMRIRSSTYAALTHLLNPIFGLGERRKRSRPARLNCLRI